MIVEMNLNLYHTCQLLMLDAFSGSLCRRRSCVAQGRVETLLLVVALQRSEAPVQLR